MKSNSIKKAVERMDRPFYMLIFNCIAELLAYFI
jgi:hypothetical protein